MRWGGILSIATRHRLRKGTKGRIRVRSARGTMTATAVQRDSKRRPKTTTVRLRVR